MTISQLVLLAFINPFVRRASRNSLGLDSASERDQAIGRVRRHKQVPEGTTEPVGVMCTGTLRSNACN